MMGRNVASQTKEGDTCRVGPWIGGTFVSVKLSKMA